MFEKTDRVLLLDGDVFAFRYCAASEEEIDWEDDFWTLHTNLGQAKARILDSVAECMEIAGCNKMVWAFSAPGNWRKQVMSSYKSNRKGKRKPLGYVAVCEFFAQFFPSFVWPTLEADDVLGVLMTEPKDVKRPLVTGERFVCCSIDKDMRTIPGLHLNPQKLEEGVVEVTEEEADFAHLKQALMGDSTDGYSGCPGVGPVKAEKLLSENVSWETVLKSYKAAGLGEKVALQNARVARILRYGEYMPRKREVKLWTP